MEQPVPKVDGKDVERVVRRDFGAGEFDAVMEVLGSYGARGRRRDDHRVRLAALKLADGDIDALRFRMEAVMIDYRDVLAMAEYPEYMAKVPPGKYPPVEVLRAIVERDWEQYESWLSRK